MEQWKPSMSRTPGGAKSYCCPVRRFGWKCQITRNAKQNTTLWRYISRGLVGEWLAKQGYDYIKPEFTYGKSRIDFYMEKGEQKYLLEVKGCTLEVDGIGYFPDAPTERGVKHLHELAQAQQAGYRCAVAFVIQMEGITEVRPNVSTQPEFGTALAEAKAAGVRVLFLLCRVGRDSLEIVEQREG